MALPPQTGTLPDVPLLVVDRIVALVAPALASPPKSWGKERAEEFGTLLKLCSALPAWAGAVRDLGLVANVRVNEHDVHDGQRLSCTLADGTTSAKVPLSLVRSLHVSNGVPSRLEMTEMKRLCATKLEKVDMRAVDILPPVKHLEILQCRSVNDKLSGWFGVWTGRSLSMGNRKSMAHTYMRAIEESGWHPQAACHAPPLQLRHRCRWGLGASSAPALKTDDAQLGR
jgi:hypothetical protein